ncbi:MAG: hypothetical protein AB1Z98_22975 [Nannocystaceae bacterium]
MRATDGSFARLPMAAIVCVVMSACGDDGSGQATDTTAATGSTTTGSSGSSGSTSSTSGPETTAADTTDGTASGSDGSSGTTTGDPSEQELLFPSSLHAMRTGKETFYTGLPGAPGFEQLTNVPYDALACSGCHGPTLADGTPVDVETYEPSCADCHADPQMPTPEVPDPTCLGCHGRQAAEINLDMAGVPHMSDVHRAAGMTCVECHYGDEMHGDGNEYLSMLEPGAPRAECIDCHAAPPSNMAHNLHITDVDCASCHTQSVIACNNCHFETELEADMKRFYGPPPFNGFSLLVNREQTGRVHPATYQSLTYGGQSFMVIAPYYPHTVGPVARTCDDCHASAALQQLEDTGVIDFVRWDEATQTLTGPSGVVPVPLDWYQSMIVDFLDYTAADLSAPTDPDAWQYQQTGIDLDQMLFASPLTAAQIDALRDGG